MTTFLLIRHGETDASGKVLTGWTPGWHLNEKGRRQALQLAQRLSPLSVRAVYSSPLERTVETAEAIADRFQTPVQIAEDLGELRFGAWEGCSIEALEAQDEWRRYHAQRGWVRPPGGELLAEVQSRMIRRIDCLRLRHSEETVAIVSHGDPLRAAVCQFLGIPLDLIGRFELDPGSVSVVEGRDWGWRVLRLNDTGELQP
jgi:probable phosphoglycerate mutase